MNDSLPQLPEYDPHPDLWARIERDLNRLDTDTVSLRYAVQDLPEHDPQADLWQAIESRLNEEKTAIVRPLWGTINPSRWTRLAVAAVVVLVGGWLVLQTTQSDAVRLEYTVENATAAAQNDRPERDEPTVADQRAEAFIEQQCAEQQLACQRPEVHELRNQLTEITV